MATQDWNQRYIDCDIPWDSGVPAEQLKCLLSEDIVKPARMLELGCGTGTNAIFLAQSGFDVTAVDIAEEAILRAKAKAEKAGVKINFMQADVTALPNVGAPFPFVFDRGTYHVVRRTDVRAFQSMLAQMVAPNGYYFVLAGNPNEEAPPEKGPPRVSASDLCAELEGAAFDLVYLKESQFHGVRVDGDNIEPLAWVGLFRRRQNLRQ